jgi:hypothetical protein
MMERTAYTLPPEKYYQEPNKYENCNRVDSASLGAIQSPKTRQGLVQSLYQQEALLEELDKGLQVLQDKLAPVTLREPAYPKEQVNNLNENDSSLYVQVVKNNAYINMLIQRVASMTMGVQL